MIMMQPTFAACKSDLFFCFPFRKDFGFRCLLNAPPLEYAAFRCVGAVVQGMRRQARDPIRSELT
jgi:hypothetical protein